MNKQDRRVHRTRKLLTDSLISLTLERGFEAVTIRDITNHANIGYATFFRHYPDKNALLADVLEVLLDELMSLLQPISTDADPQHTGTLVFRHAHKHSELYRVLLSSHASTTLLKRVREVGVQNVLATFHPRQGSAIPAEVAANHIISSFIALIQWWLEHNMPYPPERMGEIYSELIMRPTQAVAFSL